MSYKGIHSKLITLFSLLLTILFVYTAVSKLIQLEVFEMRLEQMPYISPLASWLKWLVPFAELVIVGLLLIGKYRAMGMYASFILMGIFTLYIAAVLQFSEYVPCSCGGVLSTLHWNDHIVFNMAFMVLALVAIILDKKQTKDKLLNKKLRRTGETENLK